MKRLLLVISIFLFSNILLEGCRSRAKIAGIPLSKYIQDLTISDGTGIPIDSVFRCDALCFVNSASAKQFSIIYCLNSSCSFCIASYLSFCENVGTSNSDITIWTLSFSKDRDLVLYYIERWQEASANFSKTPIVLPAETKYPYQETFINTDAFLVFNGRIVASIDNQLLVHSLLL